ncbi:MAG: putative ABC transporter permease, partial [Ruminococcus sp.]|nr:putative ABC transporter permease [Ruminococcus sp.]
MKILTELLWVFSVFSFLGWVVRLVPEVIKKRHMVNPGFITMPFLPSNGIAMVLVYVLFSKAESSFIIFFGSAILLTIYKFFLSMLFEKSFGFKWKDYSKKKFNLNGYVSVWEPFVFGCIGALSVRYAFNSMMSLISGIPAWLALLIPGVIAALILSDLIISIITVIGLWKNLKQMKNLSEL